MKTGWCSLMARASSDLQHDRERPGLGILGHLLDPAEPGGLALERLGGDAVDDLVELAAEVDQGGLEEVGSPRLDLPGAAGGPGLQLLAEALAQRRLGPLAPGPAPVGVGNRLALGVQ